MILKIKKMKSGGYFASLSEDDGSGTGIKRVISATGDTRVQAKNKVMKIALDQLKKK